MRGGITRPQRFFGHPIWWLVGIVVAVAISAQAAVSIYPAMDGWSHFPLGSSVLFPYRDYAFPTTPALYWEAQLADLATNPLMTLRLALLLVPAALAWSLMRVAAVYVSLASAAVIAVLGVASVNALGLEAIGGWNAQSWTLTSVGVAFSVQTLDRAWIRKDSPGWVFWVYALAAGSAFSLAVLVKQSAALPIGTVLVGLLVWSRLRFADASRRSVVRLCGVVSAVLFSVLFLLFGYLSLNQAWNPFLANLTGGKNPTAGKAGSSLSAAIDYSILAPSVVAPLMAVAGAVLLLLYVGPRRGTRGTMARLAAFMTLIIVTFRAFLVADAPATGWLILVALVLALAGIGLSGQRTPLSGRPAAIALTVIVIVVPALVSFARSDWSWKVWSLSAPGLQGVLASSVLAGVGLLGVGLVTRDGVQALDSLGVRCRSEEPNCSPHLGSTVGVIAVLLVLGSLSALLSGPTIAVQWFLPSLAVLLAISMAWLVRQREQAPLGDMLFAFVCVTTTLLIASSLLRPYAWWGWVEPSVLASPRVTAELSYLSGLSLAENEYNLYSRIREAELRAAELSESGRPTVFSFPNIPAVLSVSDLEPYAGIYCVILWYDLCSDADARDSLLEFKRNPPDVIVWADLDPSALAIHEQLYVNGRSVLREWQEYRDRQVRDGRWIAVDAIPRTLRGPNTTPITVYFRASDEDYLNSEGDLARLDFGSIKIEKPPPTESESPSLDALWAWLPQGASEITIRSRVAAGITGGLLVNLNLAPCLSAATLIVTTNGQAESYHIERPFSSRQVFLPFTVRPNAPAVISLQPQGGSCTVDGDARPLSVRVSDMQLLAVEESDV